MGKRFVVLLAVLVALAAIPAPVAADETRTGGTVIVEEGETINDDLTAFAGTVIIRGTVNGHVSAFAGNVFVEGRVNGDLDAFAGNVRVNGTVTGGINAFGGNVLVAEGARVGGNLEAAAGNVVLNGEVVGDARVGAETITVGPSAVVAGDLAYDGNLELAEEAQIDGQVREEDDLGLGFSGPAIPNWVGWAYSFFVNLALGAAVLLVFPRFSSGVAAQATAGPLRCGGVGLLAFVGIPILLVILFISLVGIPLGLIGMLVYAVLLWLGYILGSFALGQWAVDLADADSRWLALFVGLLAVSVLGLVPILGPLVQFVVLLVGLGALVMGGRRRYQGRRERRTADSSVDSSETVA